MRRLRVQRDTVNAALRGARRDLTALRTYRARLAEYMRENPGATAAPPRPTGYRPAPGERAMGREAYRGASSEGRAAARDLAGESGRLVDEAAARGAGAPATPVPGTPDIIGTARSVARTAMDDAGLGPGRSVPGRQGLSVGRDLHQRIEGMWQARPELQGIPLRPEAELGALLPANSPLRGMRVDQFLNQTGRSALADVLPARMLRSRITSLRLDLFARLPDGSLLVFDLTSREQAAHVAKTMLYGLFFESEGRLIHFVEVHWRGL
jgi:hypothetical protein